MSAAAPIQVRRKCWRNRLYQIWSKWLPDPIGLQPCSLGSRACLIAWTRVLYPKAIAIALGAVVDDDNGRGQAI